MPTVFMSFDVEEYDCLENLDRIHAILKKTGVKATFFVTVRAAEMFYPALIKLIHEGHEIGCHTYSHSRLSDKKTNLRKELIDSKKKIENLLHVAIHSFRAPFLDMGGKRMEEVYNHLLLAGYTINCSHISPQILPHDITEVFLSRIVNYSFLPDDNHFMNSLVTNGDYLHSNMTLVKKLYPGMYYVILMHPFLSGTENGSNLLNKLIKFCKFRRVQFKLMSSVSVNYHGLKAVAFHRR